MKLAKDDEAKQQQNCSSDPVLAVTLAPLLTGVAGHRAS